MWKMILYSEWHKRSKFYDPMILSLFNYCWVIWDGCGKTNRDFLNKLQLRTARIIEGRKVKSAGGTFSWPSLENHTKYHTCLQAFKYLHGLTLAYPLNGFSFSCKYYSFNTRYRDLLQLPLLKHRNIKVPLVTKVQMRGILWPINYETWFNCRPNFKKLLKLHLCNWCDVLWNVMYAFYLKCKL